MRTHQHEGETYSKIFDQRKRRMRGLWQRNEPFYAQLTVEDDTGRKVVRRVRLEDADGVPVATVAEAVKAMNKLKVKRDESSLALETKRTPTFAQFAASYFAHFAAVKDAKRPANIAPQAHVCRGPEPNPGAFASAPDQPGSDQQSPGPPSIRRVVGADGKYRARDIAQCFAQSDGRRLSEQLGD